MRPAFAAGASARSAMEERGAAREPGVPAAFAVLAGALDDAVLGLRADGRIAAVNAPAEQLLARPADTLVGRSLAGVLHSVDLGCTALALADALGARTPGAEQRIVVHDAAGRPSLAWRVVHLDAALGEVATLVVARPHAPGSAADADSAQADAAAAAPPIEPGSALVPPAEGETLAAVARELARAGADVSAALRQLAAGARALLRAEGACVVELDGGRAHVAAADGLLAPLAGHDTALMAPPSLFHEAATERRVVVSNAAEHDPRVDPRYGVPFGMRQVLVAPLLIDDAAAAVLCVVNGARGAFTVTEGSLAQRLADHGAVALRNARLFRATERAARHARLLADAGRVLAGHVTPRSFFPALAQLVHEALGVSGFRVLLADPVTRHVERLYAGGTGRAMPDPPAELFWRAHGGVAVRTRTSRFFTDVAGAAHAQSGDDALATGGPDLFLQDAHALGVGAAALLPLVVEREARGLLVLHYPAPRPFDADERTLLTDFAAQVAVAVRNVSLLEARQRARARAEAAAAVARAALDARALHAGAAAILAAIAPLVPSVGLALSLVDRERGRLHYVAASGAAAHLSGREVPLEVALRPDVFERPDAFVELADLRATMSRADELGTVDAGAVLVALAAQDRVIGAVCALVPRGERLAPAASEALRALAPTAALALDALVLGERTERQRAEERRLAEQLRQAEKLAALGELVAGVAHEINNPLTGISAFAELLLEEPLTADQRESARLVKREADRAIRVVRDLLTFSRKTTPAHVAFDLRALVEQTMRIRSFALRSAGIELALDCAPDLPLVCGDEGKLQQVVLNLVANAEYALRDAPVRRIALRLWHEASDTSASPLAWHPGHVVLAVTDSGPGIPPDSQARLFEPFFTTKPPGEGTGLGLSVSYGIVQAHGGEITVRSAPGTGTTFTVRLPVEPGHTPAAPVPALLGTPAHSLPALDAPTAGTPTAGTPTRGALAALTTHAGPS